MHSSELFNNLNRFQEYALSRRRLVFTNGLVFFNCIEATWSEELTCDLRLFESCEPGLVTAQLVEDDAFSELAYLFANYSLRRKIKYTADALRAAQGI